MRWTTANPQTAGLSGSIGESAMFVDVAAPTATATRMVKYAAGDTAWCTLPSQGAAPPVTSDPRSAGLDGPIGAKVMLVSAGVGAILGVASKVLNATSTAVRTVIEFDGILVTGSGGTITPQINFSANPTGTNQTLRGSYVSLELLGADTTTKVGGWA